MNFNLYIHNVASVVHVSYDDADDDDDDNDEYLMMTIFSK